MIPALTYETAVALLLLATEVVVAAAYSVLSAVYHSVYAAFVPFHSYLLAICPRGHHEAWPLQGAGTRPMAYLALQSMGGQRIRPRALNYEL